MKPVVFFYRAYQLLSRLGIMMSRLTDWIQGLFALLTPTGLHVLRIEG